MNPMPSKTMTLKTPVLSLSIATCGETAEANRSTISSAVVFNDFNAWYGDFQALSGINLKIPRIFLNR